MWFLKCNFTLQNTGICTMESWLLYSTKHTVNILPLVFGGEMLVVVDSPGLPLQNLALQGTKTWMLEVASTLIQITTLILHLTMPCSGEVNCTWQQNFVLCPYTLIQTYACLPLLLTSSFPWKLAWIVYYYLYIHLWQGTVWNTNLPSTLIVWHN